MLPIGCTFCAGIRHVPIGSICSIVHTVPKSMPDAAPPAGSGRSSNPKLPPCQRHLPVLGCVVGTRPGFSQYEGQVIDYISRIWYLVTYLKFSQQQHGSLCVSYIIRGMVSSQPCTSSSAHSLSCSNKIFNSVVFLFVLSLSLSPPVCLSSLLCLLSPFPCPIHELQWRRKHPERAAFCLNPCQLPPGQLKVSVRNPQLRWVYQIMLRSK